MAVSVKKVKKDCVTVSQKKFKTLGKAQRRIIILKDVLARLSKQKITPGFGSYIDGYIQVEDLGKKQQAHQVLPVVEEACTVCALGAMFLSHIRKGNSVKLDQILELPNEDIPKEKDWP